MVMRSRRSGSVLELEAIRYSSYEKCSFLQVQRWGLGSLPDADGFAHYAETHFGTLCWIMPEILAHIMLHYAENF